MNKIIFQNKALFLLYGVMNIALITLLLILIILVFNEIHLFSREVFVLIVALQMGFFFLVRIHYVAIVKDDKSKVVKLVYTRKFNMGWKRKAVNIDIPFKEFDGVELEKKTLGIWQIRLYKLSDGQRYQLGPLKMGWLSQTKIEQIKKDLSL